MGIDDPARVEALLDACIARGLVEEDASGSLHGTRQWNGALQKAAEVLNRQVAETGLPPPNHPIEAAVQKALEMRGESFPAGDRDDVVRVLTLLELSGMSESKRAQYGPYP